MTLFAITGARVLEGTHIHDDHAVIVQDGQIQEIREADALPAGLERQEVTGLLAPGFIDIQVNGGGGVLFNDRRSVAGIRAVGAAHRRFGTTGFLPTFITDTRGNMEEAVAAVRKGLEEKVPGLLGIHLEGPFLNPERKGVHDPAHIRLPQDGDLAIMTGLGAGRTLVTLAPEMVPPGFIARLFAAGVTVSAGHSAADIPTLREAVREGLSGFTHLYNAMPPLAGRAPGPVGAALTMPETWASVIADMIHVAPQSLRVALAAKGAEKIMLITDAMPSVGSDRTSFALLGRKVMLEDGRLVTAEGTLAGAHLDMATAVRNAVAHLGVSVEDALCMASAVPAAFLGLDSEIGRIAPGYRASLVLLDDDLSVKATWIDGEEDSAG